MKELFILGPTLFFWFLVGTSATKEPVAPIVACRTSDDPFYWEVEDNVLAYNTHAFEVVEDNQENWYVSHCGRGQCGLYLTSLSWEKH